VYLALLYRAVNMGAVNQQAVYRTHRRVHTMWKRRTGDNKYPQGGDKTEGGEPLANNRNTSLEEAPGQLS